MKVLLIGADGQLGKDIQRVFAGCEIVKTELGSEAEIELDVRDADAVMRCVEDARPSAVINTSAYHHVGQCEEHPETSFAVNALGARHLADACKAHGAMLVHISTDYVFGDGHTSPIPEDARPHPVNIYGCSKLAGEHLIAASGVRHAIVRTAALYGHHPCKAKGGMNFVELMKHLAATRDVVRVVNDEFTTPTYAVELAKQLRAIVDNGVEGVVHATCEGECSWHEFATAIFRIFELDGKLEETTVREFEGQPKVRRPSYSVLENAELKKRGLHTMPHWEDALAAYASER